MSKKTVGIIAIAVVVIAALAGAVLWFVPVLKVSTIDVQGTVNTSQEEIVEVMPITEGENLLRADVGGAAQAVAALPWVGEVTVNRSLPGTVAVTVVEREAVLWANRSDGDHLIDREGQAFLIGTPPPEAVEVTGSDEDSPELYLSLLNVIAALDEADGSLRGHVARIDASSDLDITLHLHDGREIYWGADELNHDKALAMRSVIGREGQQWNISSPSMVTVR